MKLASFVFLYERSLIALNQEAQDLNDRIALIQGKKKIDPRGRLASRLSLYQHQLACLKQKHRYAVCWFVMIAEPIFSVMAKRLGSSYQGCLVRASSAHASLRFIHSHYGADRSLILSMTMARLCTEPSN
jgi:hypothetical protein